jgi:hypothetical protein
VTSLAGSPFPEGHDPDHLVFDPTGHFLYALNPNDQSVSGFAVDPVTGVLTELPASPCAVGGGAAPQFIAMEPSGKFLYVIGTLLDPFQGTFTQVSYYAIDAGGSLSSTAEDKSSPVPLSPVGIVSLPGDYRFSVAGTTPSDAISILTLELDPLTGKLNDTHFSPGSGQFAKSVALAPDGQFLFIGRGQGQGVIDTYVLPDDGIFDPPVSTFSIPGASTAPSALATDAAGAYLYAAVANLGLLGFFVDGTSGGLSALPAGPFVGSPVSPSVVIAADSVPAFPNFYFEQRVFEILASGELSEGLPASPLPVPNEVTGIATASPLDPPPTNPVAPISAPVTSLSPSSLSFPEQAVGVTSAAQSVSLSNTGNALLVVSGISLTGADASDFVLSQQCLAVLIPHDSCAINITFRPQSEGFRQASLQVVDNAADSPHMIPLTGTAKLPFTLQLDTFSSTITAGQTAQYSLHLAPIPGFLGKVSLSCIGAPDQGTCDVPASLDLNGAATVPFSVTVTTTAGSATGSSTSQPPDSRGIFYDSVEIGSRGAVLTLLFLSLLGLAVRRGARSGLAAPALLICACLILVSCAGTTGPAPSNAAGPSSPSPSPPASPPPSATGTPPGQYTLTVTAAFETVNQTVELNLSVQ